MPEDLKLLLDIKNKILWVQLVFSIKDSHQYSSKVAFTQPFRLLAHNGEINAIRGNRNWAKTRSSFFKSKLTRFESMKIL
ncbi:MAG: hypothetical protein Ct9H90mP6_10320 [Gammaproteobacteria bacterium]|nr:MAG: hypothetical protein Ct9H90mP6_10320 [Gammaproteobacteria bacterium]